MLLKGEELFKIYKDQPIEKHVEETLNIHDGGLRSNSLTFFRLQL